MARIIVQNKHQNEMCYDEVGLCDQNIDIILSWIGCTTTRAHVISIKTFISTFNSHMPLINSLRVPSSKVLSFEEVNGLENGKVVTWAFTSISDIGSILPPPPPESFSFYMLLFGHKNHCLLHPSPIIWKTTFNGLISKKQENSVL